MFKLTLGTAWYRTLGLGVPNVRYFECKATTDEMRPHLVVAMDLKRHCCNMITQKLSVVRNLKNQRYVNNIIKLKSIKKKITNLLIIRANSRSNILKQTMRILRNPS